MAQPFLGEIRIMSFNFPPKSWAMANGQLLPINQNQALFSLLGTTFGGNGMTTFALPNLQSRTPVHFGHGIVLGESAGKESHVLTVSEMPTHTHPMNVSNTAATASSAGTTLALSRSAGANLYGAATNLAAMDATAVQTAGGSQAHENRQPFTVLNFCICLLGIFPSTN